MATAPADTFQDWAADPTLQAEVDADNAILVGRVKRDLGGLAGGAVADTVATVNADSTKRKQMIDNNNLLKGVIMGSDGPLVSTMDLIVAPDVLPVSVNQRATIQTTSVEAEYTEKLMTSNYTAVAVKASAPYITANADYTSDTTYKNSTTEKTIMVSSRYMFPQGTVQFNPPLLGVIDPVQLSPSFTDAISAALGQSTRAAQREALDTVFNTFGHVFRTKVRIGGALSAHTMTTFKRTEDETSVKLDIKAGLEASVKSWGASGSSGHGNSQTTIVTKEGRTVSVDYAVNGGDYTLIKDTSAWVDSTTQSANWRVIEVSEVTPVVDMLPDTVRDQVKTLMTPLFGKWVATMLDPDVPPDSTNPIYMPLQPMPSGWFFLGWSTDSSQALLVKPTLPGKSGRNVAVMGAKTTSTDPPTPVAPVDGYGFIGSYIKTFDATSAPGNQYGAIRPGLFLEGNWTGKSFGRIIHPNAAAASEDECFDLSTISVQASADGNVPRDRWVLRKNAVLFNSPDA